MNVKEVSALREALEQANEDKGLLQDEVRELKHEIDRLKIRLRELWGASCEQVVEHDKEISFKDEEIASLKERLSRLSPSILEVSDTVVTRPVPPLPLPSISTEHEARSFNKVRESPTCGSIHWGEPRNTPRQVAA